MRRSIGPFHGHSGADGDGGVGVLVFDRPARDPVQDGGVGTGAADRVRLRGAAGRGWTSGLRLARGCDHTLSGLLLRGIVVSVWRSGEKRSPFLPGVSGAADDHLCGIVLRDSLPLWGDAVGDPAVGASDDGFMGTSGAESM